MTNEENAKMPWRLVVGGQPFDTLSQIKEVDYSRFFQNSSRVLLNS